MKVLITGGAGYLGSLLSTFLIEKGMHIVVYDKLLYGGEGLLSLLSHPRFQLVVGDIRDTPQLQKATEAVDAIVHLAALVGEEACLVSPAATAAINEYATSQLVTLAMKSGSKRMIFSSTCSNYGLLDSDMIATEDSVLKPLSLYARAKIAGEQSVMQVSSSQLATCIVRFGTLCGLSPRMRFNLLVNNMARSAALGRKISIFTPDAWRPFLHIRDAVEVIYQCLTAPSTHIAHQIFNVVGENYQKRQLAQLVTKHCPHTQIVIKKDTVDARDYRVSGSRIAKKLNFYPKHTIEEAFTEIVHAVKSGVLVDPFRAVYEALPDIKQLTTTEL